MSNTTPTIQEQYKNEIIEAVIELYGWAREDSSKLIEKYLEPISRLDERLDEYNVAEIAVINHKKDISADEWLLLIIESESEIKLLRDRQLEKRKKGIVSEILNNGVVQVSPAMRRYARRKGVRRPVLSSLTKSALGRSIIRGTARRGAKVIKEVIEKSTDYHNKRL